MSIQKMLEYQKIDIGYYRREMELRKSEEVKRANACKAKYIECNNALQTLKQKLSVNAKAVQNAQEKIDQLNAMRIKGDEQLENASSDEDFAAFAKTLEDLEKAVDSLTKDLAKATKAVYEVAAQNRSVNDTMDALNREYLNCTNIFNKKKAAFDAETKDLRDQLESLSKEIEPEYFDRYQQLRKNKKMPAFVCYTDKNCGACGMDISIEVDKKLQNPGDVAECPHCGRIVYKA